MVATVSSDHTKPSHGPTSSVRMKPTVPAASSAQIAPPSLASRRTTSCDWACISVSGHRHVRGDRTPGPVVARSHQDLALPHGRL